MFEKNQLEKIALVAVNSQYIHGMLAPYYIKENSSFKSIEIKTYNINMDENEVIADLLKTDADLFSFTTYVFNIDFIKKISVKLMELGKVVIFGGVEAENDIDGCLNFCHHILCGDGEVVFDEFLNSDKSQIVYRASKFADLASIKSPYSEEYFADMNDKIAYFEGSRGCPFRCSYCMSSNYPLVLSSVERVKEDLTKFFYKNIRVLKFVDRTFNAKKDFSNEILKFCVDNQEKFSYQIHFEIAPELINEEMIKILKGAKENFIRMEIGMQSLNEDTLKSIKRPFDVDLLKSKISSLCCLKNIECHVDIIAGLPFEDFKSLTMTFDNLYKMNPSEIQLGMLKMLPNSDLIKENIDGYEYSPIPPYQIKTSPVLDMVEIEHILKIEKVVNKVYNSGKFVQTLNYVFGQEQSPFSLFSELTNFIGEAFKLSLFSLYEKLLNFLTQKCYDKDLVKDLLRFDYASTNNSRILPPCLYVKYNKKYVKGNLKSNLFPLPMFHNIFDNFEKKEMLILFDYHKFNHLEKVYNFSVPLDV